MTRLGRSTFSSVPTFEEMARLEPALHALAGHMEMHAGTCVRILWEGNGPGTAVSAALANLVGPSAETWPLRHDECYTVAEAHLRSRVSCPPECGCGGEADELVAHFAQLWDARDLGPRVRDWEALLRHWVECGLTRADIDDAVDITVRRAADISGEQGRWRYFTGICRNKLTGKNA